MPRARRLRKMLFGEVDIPDRQDHRHHSYHGKYCAGLRCHHLHCSEHGSREHAQDMGSMVAPNSTASSKFDLPRSRFVEFEPFVHLEWVLARLWPPKTLLLLVSSIRCCSITRAGLLGVKIFVRFVDDIFLPFTASFIPK